MDYSWLESQWVIYAPDVDLCYERSGNTQATPLDSRLVGFERRFISNFFRSGVLRQLWLFPSDLLHPTIRDRSSQNRSRFCIYLPSIPNAASAPSRIATGYLARRSDPVTRLISPAFTHWRPLPQLD